MRLVGGAKLRSGTYVIKPERIVMDMQTGMANVTKPLRVKFSDHRADLAAHKVEYDWSDDEYEIVKKYMLEHRDFGKGDGRGFFIDSASTRRGLTQQELDAKVEAGEIEERCLWIEDHGSETRQCPKAAVTADGYCQAHHEELVELTAS